MSIVNFIPEIWSSEVLLKLRASLKYAQPGMINRDYEGEIAQAGDTVHITNFDDVSVTDYTPNSTSIAYSTLTDHQQSFVINQKKYFAFKVDDVDKRQALKTFMGAVMQGAAWQMAKVVDTYVSSAMAAGVANGVVDVAKNPDGLNNRFGAVLASATGTSAITSLTVSPLSASIASGSNLQLNDGAGHVQTATTSAAASAGATSVSITSLTPAVSYAVGLNVPVVFSVALGPEAYIGTTEPAGDVSAYQVILKLKTALDKSYTPSDGRWVVVNPDLYAYLLQDRRFIEAQRAGTTEGLRNGQVGSILGFDVIESNTVPNTSGAWTILAGHSMATTYADQIVETEALRLQDSFSDAVRGLHVFDSTVVRPQSLASATVTLVP